MTPELPDSTARPSLCAATGSASPTLLMRCLQPGCPRTKRVARAEVAPDVPAAAVEVHSFCPWHDGRCDKAYPEYYYNAEGRLLDSETGSPRGELLQNVPDQRPGRKEA